MRKRPSIATLALAAKRRHCFARCLTGSGLDEHIALFDASAVLGIDDHALSNAILDTATCIEVFALCEHFALDASALRNRIETYERRIADVIENAVTDLRHRLRARVRVRILHEETHADTSACQRRGEGPAAHCLTGRSSSVAADGARGALAVRSLC